MVVYYDRAEFGKELFGANRAMFWNKEGFVSDFGWAADCVWMVPGTFTEEFE